ncbi:hypothetical protein STCU_06056 [Strigomonas culicis]|uniref:Uncharacterized protein n=1 Tax=Strigomonas culicis TaxID=28005 RepID=S9U7V5_9TRYP|nr:hypothetical protein STCU_06056 [Strigomonas culicis]|eukprot:EPY26832.1 hypothetical protein STCU_06056 [Strigomonas culicis]
MPPVTKEPVPPGSNVNKKVEITPDSKPNSISLEEADRQTKLGIFLVNTGIAQESQVFAGNAEIMKAVRNRQVPDLLVINRPQDDWRRHPIIWYKPWTWFFGGPRVSPMLWTSMPPPPPPPPQPERREEGSQTDAASPTEDKAVDLPPVVIKKPEPTPPAAKKRSGLPPVVMEPLKDSVVEGLAPAVRADRENLLKAETSVHKILQGIEDTRYKYLVPSTELSCEAEVVEVVKCYAVENANAAKKKAAILKAREDELAKGYSNRIDEDGYLDKPIVLFDALNCGPKVKNLRQCTEKMLKDYSDGVAI